MRSSNKIRATKLTDTSYAIGGQSSLRVPAIQTTLSPTKPNIIIPGQQNKPSAKLII